MPKEDSLPMRKKMRKGTHSCFECRRRKIRCIFQSDNPDVCSECFARGSRCVDQENANPDVIVDHRKNLRERVSRLEALVDSLLEDKTVKSESPSNQSQAETASPRNMYTKDTFPPTPLSSEASSNVLRDSQRVPSSSGRHHIPILSVFEDALNDAEEKIKARMGTQHKPMLPLPNDGVHDRYTVVNKHPDDLPEESPAASAKRERVKQALIAMLPAYDQLTNILTSNSEWWQTWRRKCSGTSGPEQTLAQFAAQAITNSNIGAIGTVVLAVGICSSADNNDVERYTEAVDRWVLSDDEYAASLEGMECLILKSKWFADIGQPRRSWVCYRKGLMYAQLMGLHRKRTASVAHESIWWGLYHGDRFLSLLLGLPYGISDSHCDLTMPNFDGEFIHPLVFITNVSKLAGRVIDRNQGVAEQSFAWALQLDQELEDLWKRLDPSWVDYSELLATPESNAAELRERIMAQMIYHQIRVYLHLPFMLKAATNSRFTYSRTACLNGSREVLRLYQALRTGTVQPLYECKAVDFVGFTSAVLIQIGLFNFAAVNANGTQDAHKLREVEADMRLIEISIDIFRRASSEKGGKVALQSAEVLEKMQGKFKGGVDAGTGPCQDGGECHDLVIPYFGTITIRRGGQTLRGMPPPPPCLSPTAAASSRSAASAPAPLLYTPTSEKSGLDGATVFSGAPTQALNLTPASSLSAPTHAASFALDPSPFVSYDGFYNFGALADDAAAGAAGNPTLGLKDDSMNNYPLPTNNFSWQNMPMDIDQDWSWFLNDGQTQGGGVGAPVPAQAGTMDAFSTGFTGFG
ncbi:uncharacterized protein M421DRAFT_60016 [Didymella exigua CBS 183.55]|uniref:Zn(2)-C6 fungal-type domain-containing protein n=1 Tax=Didymella exigua CBS 183.55 TaxID=1150837 RepID=A0A6A5RRI2_9PLEO|nr:uncharacterized protein M421DRAFT_60016 [Didymella exigua CBS 183.55]KAF1929664.1 hypothetical protein M421DRAFT_60016 [Didymella exigua CBS 183.55]